MSTPPSLTLRRKFFYFLFWLFLHFALKNDWVTVTEREIKIFDLCWKWSTLFISSKTKQKVLTTLIICKHHWKKSIRKIDKKASQNSNIWLVMFKCLCLHFWFDSTYVTIVPFFRFSLWNLRKKMSSQKVDFYVLVKLTRQKD